MVYAAVPALFMWENRTVQQLGSTLHQENDGLVSAGLRADSLWLALDFFFCMACVRVCVPARACVRE